MRKLLGFVLVGLLVTLGLAFAYPSPASQPDNVADQMMHLHAGDRPIPTGAIAQAPRTRVVGEQVTYATVDGQPISGYLSRPANAPANLPGLIVIHEWWGLNDNIRQMTDRLAGEGYTALAVDLHSGQVAQTPEQARVLVQAVAQNPQKAQENLRQAYRYLETTGRAPKIGTIGWCFGGSWSLNTALLLPDQIDATVIYYGSQLVTDAETLRPLKMPILGIFGALDQRPSVETVRAFESALKSVDKSIEVHIYEGADHAFAIPSGTRYNATAAEDAWRKTIAFLARNLKGTSG